MGMATQLAQVPDLIRERKFLISAGKLRYESYKHEKKEIETQLADLLANNEKLKAQLEELRSANKEEWTHLAEALESTRKQNDELHHALQQERERNDRAAASTINTSVLSSVPPSPLGDLHTPIHMNPEAMSRLERELEEAKSLIDALRNDVSFRDSQIQNLSTQLTQHQSNQNQFNDQTQNQNGHLVHQPQHPQVPAVARGDGFVVKGGIRVVHATPVEPLHALSAQEQQFAMMSLGATPQPLGGEASNTLFTARAIQGVISFLTGKRWSGRVERVQL